MRPSSRSPPTHYLCLTLLLQWHHFTSLLRPSCFLSLPIASLSHKTYLLLTPSWLWQFLQLCYLWCWWKNNGSSLQSGFPVWHMCKCMNASTLAWSCSVSGWGFEEQMRCRAEWACELVWSRRRLQISVGFGFCSWCGSFAPACRPTVVVFIYLVEN